MFIINFKTYSAYSDERYVGPFASEEKAGAFLEAKGYVRLRAGRDLNWWRAPENIANDFDPPPVDAKILPMSSPDEAKEEARQEDEVARELERGSR